MTGHDEVSSSSVWNPLGTDGQMGSLNERLSPTQERPDSVPFAKSSNREISSSTSNVEASSVAIPDIDSPLSIRIDKDPEIHKAHNAQPGLSSEHPVSFVVPQSLHYNPEPSIDPTNLMKHPELMCEHNFSHEGGFSETNCSPVHGVNLGPFEFAIPLTMDTRVKDEYDSILMRESRYIRQFAKLCMSAPQEDSSQVEGKNPKGYVLMIQKNRLTRIMESMIDELYNVCTHSDLNMQSQSSSESPDAAREAAWAEYSSSKFQFLNYFIEAAGQDIPIQVMIFSKKPAMKIIETYLLGKGFVYPKIDSQEHEKRAIVLGKKAITFELRDTGSTHYIEPFDKPQLIIAFDSSFNTNNTVVKSLRSHNYIDNELVPVIRLIISHSCEHVERSLPSNIDGFTFIRLLVQYSLSQSGNTGELQDNDLGVQENAERVLEYLTMNSMEKHWPIHPMVRIPIEYAEASDDLGVRPLIPGQKRQLISDNDRSDSLSKRQRMTPLHDITHVSDSVQESSQGQLNTRNNIEINMALTEQVKQLRDTLVDTRLRLTMMETDFAQLQHRYETRTNRFHKVRQELEQLIESSKRSGERIERQKSEIAKLKDERIYLQNQLASTLDRTKSEGGLRAELAESRETSIRLEKENISLQRNVNQERSQAEYIRIQYQNASTSASKSAVENNQLNAILLSFKQKASGDIVKLREIRSRDTEQVHLMRLAELETIISNLQGQLARKEEDIRDLTRNRPATRGTSIQPRSPKLRMSRSMSPGTSHNGGNGHYPHPPGSAGKGSALRYRMDI